MTLKIRKVSDISSDLYTIFGYCPDCSVYHFLDTEKYADYSSDDLHCKVNCPECGNLGIDYLIVPNN